jgi:demethylmenaquinone methyltransferase/2-methoxy-6-polyprenyl-1,4-benzoquinol methylase
MTANNKTASVQAMFNAIAHRYDLLNHLLSLGTDIYWRREAIAMLEPLKPKRILDIGTGTGDLAIAALRLNPQEIIGVDIAEEMLKLGDEKLQRLHLNGVVKLQTGNAEELEFPDDSFDAVMVAFGVRNFENLERGLAEMFRVLRREGAALILEFSSPGRSPLRQVYSFYFRKILPIIGGTISGHREAYRYLPRSVESFPDGDGFLEVLRKCGFRNPRQRRLTFGIASIYLAFK